MKNQKGITLIALVVTIIVLLILAGISIAMLTGDNGIITRTNDSKMSQIEGQVKEEIKLAVQSAKIFATQKSVETSGGNWFAANTGTKNELGLVLYEMRQDLTRTDSTTAATDDKTNTTLTTKKAIMTSGKYDLVGYCVEGTPYQAASENPVTPAVPTTITVTYTTPAYQSATNEPLAHIIATITVEENNFTLATINAYRDGTTAKSIK